MKKIATFITLYFITTNILLAEEKKCSDIKKLSKEFLSCAAKNIKEISAKKTKEIKKSTEIKSNQIKDGTKKIGNKIKDKLKRKE
tara:strand:- start:490 stop:744 length:255 start_codon:yes stop_codon:yes gene_type:complete